MSLLRRIALPTLNPALGSYGDTSTSWRLEIRSRGSLDVDDGALYYAFHRMEEQGLLASEWHLTDNNRRARYYRLRPRPAHQSWRSSVTPSRQRRFNADPNIAGKTLHLNNEPWEIDLAFSCGELTTNAAKPLPHRSPSAAAA